MNSPVPNPRRFAGNRRAFALPVVVLLSVVGTLLLASLLTRGSGQALAVARQVRDAHDHHMARGLQEVLTSWLRTLGGIALPEAIGQGGRVLTITLSGKRELRVWMFQDQWQVLGELSGLQGTDLLEARAALRAARDLAPKADPDRYVRRIGPIAIDARNAPLDLIRAVTRSAIDEGDAAAFAGEIDRLRRSGELTQSSLLRAAEGAQVDATSRGRLLRLFTAEATLWDMRVELAVPPRPGFEPQPHSRFAGRVVLARSAGSQNAGLNSLGDLLDWRQIPMDDQDWLASGPAEARSKPTR